MKEIVSRLHENRQIELAKSILEANGYKVSKMDEESSEQEKKRQSKEYLKNVDWESVEFTNDIEGMSQDELMDKFYGDTPVARISAGGSFMLRKNYLVHPDGTIVCKYSSAHPDGNHNFEKVSDKVADNVKTKILRGNYTV